MFWKKPFKLWPPKIQPTETELRQWASSEWIEYQAWIFHHSFISLHQWQQLQAEVGTWSSKPLISLVTPVFNTPPIYLHACLYSVQTQIYPHWELCLVDDGSDNSETLACLQSVVETDPRIRLQHLAHNQGICQATNHAIRMARGDYIAFLDHDDRLAVDALYQLAKTILTAPELDIIYSDRDMLSPQDLRFMHLFKPDWSPETLLSGNYLFHLVLYRRQLLAQLQGVRVGFEGSQDYDLILRAADNPIQVHHIPKILYHWRQHEHSVAQIHDVKEYAYTAGIKALEDTLARRGLSGQVSENKALWRGNYRVQLHPPTTHSICLQLTHLHQYAQHINQAFVDNPQAEIVVILGPSVQALAEDTLTELISWLHIAAVGIVTGKVLDEQQRLLHAGLVHRPNGQPLAIYEHFPETTLGYMAVTSSLRNLSAPHPACWALKRQLWQQLGGLDPHYEGVYAALDFALKGLTLGMRIVYTPFARFSATEWQTPAQWPEPDRQHFVTRWQAWLKQGDPYYNPYLTLELNDMGLDMQPPYHTR